MIYPKGFIKKMKRQKAKKIRSTPIDKYVVEQEFNNAKRIL